MQLPIDLAIGKPKSANNFTSTEYHEETRNNLSIACESQKRQYDKQFVKNTYTMGDLV